MTIEFQLLMPPKAHAFNGAARSYPPDFASDPDWVRSILRFAGKNTADELIEDALAQTMYVTPPVRRRPVWAGGVAELISGVTGNLAVLDGGQRVSIVSDRLPATLALADVLTAGDSVEGWLDDNNLAPEPADVDFSGFVEGTVTLARVVKATALRANLVLHPQGPEIILRKRDVIPRVDDGEGADTAVSDVVQVGQTLRVRVTTTGTVTAPPKLSLVDVAGENVEPLSLLRGGPPWLREGVDAVEPEPEPTPLAQEAAPSPMTVPVPPTEPARPAPAVPIRELGEVRDELAGLKDAFLRLGRELRAGTPLETLDQLRDEVASLNTALSRERSIRHDRDAIIASLRQELREAKAARQSSSSEIAHTARPSWPSLEAWLRHEVTATWAARTTASDKQHHPLKEYEVTPAFLRDLGELGESYTDKILRCVVDVLTGRASELASRSLHRLRTGSGGNDPYVTRPDKAQCWRVNVESNTASARRLHYWHTTDDRIELEHLGIHDDFDG